ncbi:MAG: NUDIX domain-containing protein [Alkalispirochaeta sp.]
MRTHDPSHHPFQHCPACGAGLLAYDGKNRFSCGQCGFMFFHNTAAACGAILLHRDELDGRDRILLLVRGRDPERGKLDFPGGFIDPGESAEEALHREIREEINVTVTSLTYFWSAPNQYEYRGVTYNTCDLVFVGRAQELPQQLQQSEIAGYRCILPEHIDVQTIAFPSLREALRRYIGSLTTDSMSDR